MFKLLLIVVTTDIALKRLQQIKYIQLCNRHHTDMTDYDFTKIAREVALREHIENHKLEFQYASNKGDGYTGTVRAVTLVGSNRKLDVVFKYSHRDPRVHEKLPLRTLYVHEIRFYEQIAPTFEAFQAEHKIKHPFNNFAGYFGCIRDPRNECLALENIKCSNYDLWDRKKEINSAHLELALRTFGKLHGTSMAMRHLNPQLFSKLIAGLDEENVWKQFIESTGFYKQITDALSTLDIFDPVSDKIYHDKLQHFQANIASMIDPILDFHDKYDVILQGDCWSNNAMYQYEDMNDRTKPKAMKLLDWQAIRTGSVVMDLSYFFYTIAPKKCLDNVEYYLKLYYDSLSDHLKAFNLNNEDVYPYDVFWEQWQNICLFGFMLTVTLRKIMLVDAELAPDFAEDAEKLISRIHLNHDQEMIYKQQMKDIIVHFVDRKFI